jgi:hypothetical protein
VVHPTRPPARLDTPLSPSMASQPTAQPRPPPQQKSRCDLALC